MFTRQRWSSSTHSALRHIRPSSNAVSRRKDTAVAKPTTANADAVPHADRISGAPASLVTRRVRIYRPARTAMQSGEAQTHFWRMNFDAVDGASSTRWENPLMGWASSADSVQALQFKFRSAEEAVYFAEKQGWGYEVIGDHVAPEDQKQFVKKEYAENFKYNPNKLKMIRTK